MPKRSNAPAPQSNFGFTEGPEVDLDGSGSFKPPTNTTSSIIHDQQA